MRLKTPAISRMILFACLLNLAIAPTVYAVSNAPIDRSTAYSLGLLLIIVLGLAIYLTIVIIQPERF